MKQKTCLHRGFYANSLCSFDLGGRFSVSNKIRLYLNIYHQLDIICIYFITKNQHPESMNKEKYLKNLHVQSRKWICAPIFVHRSYSNCPVIFLKIYHQLDINHIYFGEKRASCVKRTNRSSFKTGNLPMYGSVMKISHLQYINVLMY